MYRSISTQAIVIRRARVGEFHKSLSLLTADLGLISATAYGAYKAQSRLRLGSEPFTCCTALLYHNPVKKAYKVTELEITSSYEGLQGDLGRLAAASLWAEIAQRSYGAGETSADLFELFRDCLTLLERAEPELAQCLTVQFLWRFLGLSGYQPDITTCESCGAPFGDRGARHLPHAHGFRCAACASGGSVISPGALRYLGATQGQSIAEASRIGLEEHSRVMLRDILLSVVQSVLESPLASVPWVRNAR
ncbi:MAG TPA: DNA repair protein RecO [Spirochaetia bacterium]|nr:DNA repair protein RecO [Spirochaetia bacterium]